VTFCLPAPPNWPLTRIRSSDQPFATTLGVIVNGEITQLFTSRCRANRDEYYQRIYAKTASLFETCTCCAALISPVSAETAHPRSPVRL